MSNVIVVGIVLIVVTLVGVALRARAEQRTTAAHRFARKVDLALDETVQDAVVERIRARERAAALGAVLATVLAVGLIEAGTDPQHTYWMFVVLSTYFVGHAVGLGVTAWREASRGVPAGGPRLARATSPGMGDYVAGHERWGAWVVTACAVVLSGLAAAALLTGLVPEEPASWVAVGCCAVVPVMALGAAELVGRKVLDLPQVAATPLELAWDDALRSRLLRDVVTVPLVVGVWGSFVVVGTVGGLAEGGWPDDVVVGVTSALFFLLVGGALVMAMVSGALNPHRHFRRRLWPRPVPVDEAATPLPSAADDGAPTAGPADSRGRP